MRDRVVTLGEVLRALEAAGIEAADVALRRPTLDEVFLRLTGDRPPDDGDGEREAEEVAA